MRDNLSTTIGRESRVIASFRGSIARYLPLLVAITLGEVVFVIGLWFQTTTIDALLASSVGVFLSLWGYRLFEKHER
jgi:hypothetical protein